MSESLDSEVVYQNLEWQWTFFGLTWVHIVLCFAPALFYLGAAAWIESLPQAIALYIFVATFPAMLVAQWGQRAGWLGRATKNVQLPRYLDHRRHVEQPPFPVPREQLACPRR